MKLLVIEDEIRLADILSDVMLPGLDGFQLVRKLREKKNATPVLFLTARVELPRVICRFLLPCICRLPG